MSDAVVLAVASNIFWLIIILLLIAFFRKEIKLLLTGLTSIEVAGTHLQVGKGQSALKSYAILSNILVDILLQDRDLLEKNLVPLISNRNAKQLGQFIIQYADEIPSRDQDVELLKNVAAIMMRKKRFQDALSLYDALLKKRPGDPDVMNLKGVALFETGIPANIVSAEHIYDSLVANPSNPTHRGVFRFNQALTKSILGKFDEALSNLEKALGHGYWNVDFDDTSLQPLREQRPDEFKRLVDLQQRQKE